MRSVRVTLKNNKVILNDRDAKGKKEEMVIHLEKYQNRSSLNLFICERGERKTNYNGLTPCTYFITCSM